MTKFRSVVFLSVVLCFICCTTQQMGTESLLKHFKKTEYTATRGLGADGWAEARRRRLLLAYFKAKNIPVKENQLPSTGGKYRDAVLMLSAKKETTPLRIIYVLKPAKAGVSEPDFKSRQRACDLILADALQRMDTLLEKHASVHLEPGESCIDLTGQLPAPD